MVDLARLRDSLRIDEGDKSEPYLDTASRWTIATGRCLETQPLTGSEVKLLLDRGWLTIKVSQEGDDYLLDVSMSAALKQCESHFIFWERLNDAQQNALAEMAYQLGIDGLCAFHDMLKAIEERRWADAYTCGMASKWAEHDSPERARVVLRQLTTGNWPRPL